MFFVFYAPTNKELCQADAIACDYIEAIRNNQEFWNAKCFVINTELAKTSKFWIDNAENLAEAIAANQCEPKTIDRLTQQDLAAMHSFSTVKPLPPA